MEWYKYIVLGIAVCVPLIMLGIYYIMQKIGSFNDYLNQYDED